MEQQNHKVSLVSMVSIRGFDTALPTQPGAASWFRYDLLGLLNPSRYSTRRRGFDTGFDDFDSFFIDEAYRSQKEMRHTQNGHGVPYKGYSESWLDDKIYILGVGIKKT